MTRRMQLLEPERRSSTSLRLAALVDRVRAGLPRDNRFIPGALAGLALIVFVWLVAGALLGGSGVQEEQQASNQASLAQEDSDSGGPETPAPGVENRDTDSYAEFGAPRDPFRNPLDEGGNGGDRGGNGGDSGDRGGNGGDRGDNGGGGDNGDRGGNGDRGSNGDDRDGNGGNGDRNGNGGLDGNGDQDGNRDRGGGDRGDGGEDFIEQEPTPGAPGAPGSTPGSTPGGTPGGGPGSGQGGGGLFNSGGDLPIP